MGLLKNFIIVFILFYSVNSVQGLEVVYNTTFPLQFAGDNAFENITDVRVIFRAEPIDIKPGGNTSLTFLIENPTPLTHRITIDLIEVPGGFRVIPSDKVVKADVLINSVSRIGFLIEAPLNASSRTYWYGFDVIDNTLSDTGEVIETSRLLGNYHGLNVVLEEKSPIRIGIAFPGVLIWAFIVLILIVLVLKLSKTKKD